MQTVYRPLSEHASTVISIKLRQRIQKPSELLPALKQLNEGSIEYIDHSKGDEDSIILEGFPKSDDTVAVWGLLDTLARAYKLVIDMK